MNFKLLILRLRRVKYDCRKKVIFTNEKSTMIKGVAILLMFMHHLFAFPMRIVNGNSYISVFHLFNRDIEYMIGVFGKSCVSIFLFISGFGFCMSIKRKGNLKISYLLNKIKGIYINYWVIFVIFVPFRFILLKNQFNTGEFLKNFIGVSSTYNPEWWFFILYIELIISLPLLRKIINNNLLTNIIKIFLIMLLAKGLDRFISNSILSNWGIIGYIIIQLKLILFWQVPFSLGYIFAKLNIFEVLQSYILKFKLNKKLIYFTVLICIFIIRTIILKDVTLDFLITPILIIILINSIKSVKIQKALKVLGNNSTNMWLTHSFFCYYYFQNIIYSPKISIIILILLVLITLMVSIIIKKVLLWLYAITNNKFQVSVPYFENIFK